MSVLIYTARIGNHDDHHRIASQVGNVGVATFESAYEPDAQVRSRWPKWHPGEALRGLGNWEWSIWVDASIEVLSKSFALDLIEAAGDASMAVIRHPLHEDIWTELAAVEALPGCELHGHRSVVEGLAALTPTMPSVVALGVIARRRHVTAVLDDLVWTTGLRGNPECIRDQIIFPFVAQALDVRPAVIDPPEGDLWDNAWFVRHPHR